jgi:hypothetical protein
VVARMSRVVTGARIIGRAGRVIGRRSGDVHSTGVVSWGWRAISVATGA